MDDATAGLPGPAILSDRPYRKGGLVHYRYGGFHGVRVLGNDGSFDVRLRAPDGTLVDDHRKAWFSPPPWAELPFPGGPGRPATAQSAKPVLLADRFVVREAIRHSARGGVYRALDQRTGAEVIVKQARAHVAVNVTGEDARACLRREAANLTALTGLCTELVDLFEEDGHAFLVQSLVPGQALASWVTDRRAEPGFIPVPQVLALAEKLRALLDEVHRRGVVYQDFTPNNIMVTPEDRLVLIDAEWATTPGTRILRVHTPGSARPSRPRSRGSGPRSGRRSTATPSAACCTSWPPGYRRPSPRTARTARTTRRARTARTDRTPPPAARQASASPWCSPCSVRSVRPPGCSPRRSSA